MTLSSGVSVGQLLLAFAVLLTSTGVAWGGLMQRVKTLEREIEALAGFADRLTRIEERTGYVATQLDKLTGSWLFKEPPGYAELNRLPGSRR